MRLRPALVAASVALALSAAPLAHADPPPHAARHQDPPFSIDAEAAREEAVDCVDLDAPDDVDAVVLVHGTGVEGHEEHAWNYELRLAAEGIPHCVVTYPERGFGDMQVSAEYVVVAVHEAAAISPSGRVDVVGHSQGATMPRWAIKYWPSVRAVVDDMVMHAGPNHGTAVADDPRSALLGGTPLEPFAARPPVLWQLRTDSAFMRYLNHGDETPGGIDYTSIYAHTDELVQPSGAFGPATAALHVDRRHKVVNVNVQEVCPGRLVDHLSIGTTDRFVMDLTIATLRSPGPADLSTVDAAACALPDQYVAPGSLEALLEQGSDGGTSGSAWLDPSRYVTEEPEIREYAAERDGSAD